MWPRFGTNRTSLLEQNFITNLHIHHPHIRKLLSIRPICLLHLFVSGSVIHLSGSNFGYKEMRLKPRDPAWVFTWRGKMTRNAGGKTLRVKFPPSRLPLHLLPTLTKGIIQRKVYSPIPEGLEKQANRSSWMHLGPLTSAGKEAAAGTPSGQQQQLWPREHNGLAPRAGWRVGLASGAPSLERLPCPQWCVISPLHATWDAKVTSWEGRACGGGRRRGLGPETVNGLEERMGEGG